MDEAEDQTLDQGWPLRTPILAALGVVAGLVVWLLVGESGSVTAVAAALASFVVVGAMVFGFTVERDRLVPCALFALACGAVAGLILYWNGPTDRWSTSEGWRLVALGLSLGIAAPLFQAWDGKRPVRFDYVTVHDHGWANAVLFAAGWVFVGIVLAMTFALSALFELIGIEVIEQLMNSGWFPRLLVGGAYGTALGLLREQGRVVGLLQRVVMIVLRVLAPVFAAGLAIFLLALPFTGLDALWDGWASAAALMLSCMVAGVVLVNAVIGNRPADEAGNRVLRWGALVLTLVMLPLAVLAAIAIGLRIHQYGFTPDRLWALTFAVIASAYGVAYFGSVLLGRVRWSGRVRAANLRLAIATCVVALLLATPLSSFNALSTRDQVARLQSGRTPVERFDWAALKYDFGEPGAAAVRQLAASDNTAIRRDAQRALKTENRWDLALPTPPRQDAGQFVRVLPAGTPIPADIAAAMARGQGCSGAREMPCTLVLTEREALLFSDKCVIDPPRAAGRDEMIYWHCLQPTRFVPTAEGWEQVRPRDAGQVEAARREAIQAGYRAGRVEIRPVERRQVFIGGVPVGDAFE